MFTIKSKYINIPVEGGQGETIILYKDLVNKSYAVSFCVNQDLSLSLLTILLKTAVDGYTIVLRVEVCDI